MGGLLSSLGSLIRQLRPRTALALGLLLLVLLVLAIGQLVGGPAPTARPGPDVPLSTVDPTTGNDSVVELQPSPSLAWPETRHALATAQAFAEAWLAKDRPQAQWHAALAELCTPVLAQELTGVDPIAVPAERITDDPYAEVHADSYLDVVVPTDAGTLRLRLIRAADPSASPGAPASAGDWLVDGIDWERA